MLLTVFMSVNVVKTLSSILLLKFDRALHTLLLHVSLKPLLKLWRTAFPQQLPHAFYPKEMEVSHSTSMNKQMPSPTITASIMRCLYIKKKNQTIIIYSK